MITKQRPKLTESVAFRISEEMMQDLQRLAGECPTGTFVRHVFNVGLEVLRRVTPQGEGFAFPDPARLVDVFAGAVTAQALQAAPHSGCAPVVLAAGGRTHVASPAEREQFLPRPSAGGERGLGQEPHQPRSGVGDMSRDCGKKGLQKRRPLSKRRP